MSDGAGASSIEGFKRASKNVPSALFKRAISIRCQGSVEAGKSAVRGAHSPGGDLLGFPAMADPALKSTSASTLFTAASLKALIVSLLLYWGACALLLPVTTSDCQVYNLARLRVAERAGFWQAAAWNSIREVTYPWAFDAVHYPFLKTAWGFGIPSFLAFLGLLVIIFQLMVPRFGEYAALWSILTLLSMPTLMLQATTAKNDLVVVFGARLLGLLARPISPKPEQLFSFRCRPEPGFHRRFQKHSLGNFRQSLPSPLVGCFEETSEVFSCLLFSSALCCFSSEVSRPIC